MREITPTLTPELFSHCKSVPVWKAPAFEIARFHELVKHVARLSYANRDELLFFRGQDKDYQSKAGGTTLYPSIYREDVLSNRELQHRFDLLDQAGRLLANSFKKARVDGHRELQHKKYIQWSILQHYEVVRTPLLDLTQSLRVACSFAQLQSTDPTCCVYVLSLPYITNRISINSEHDIVNIRLLSICPPAALRPFFQEGYLAATTDVTDDFDSKTELDFRNRLVAKFAIPRAHSFWGKGFNQIPELALYPRKDLILELCNELKDQLREELTPGDLGEFVKRWALLEQYLLTKARQSSQRNVSVREAIMTLAKLGILSPVLAQELNALRSFRNAAVHQPETIQAKDLGIWLDRARDAANKLI